MLGSLRGQTWTRTVGGHTWAFTLTDGPTVDMRRNLVSLSATITRDGVDVTSNWDKVVGNLVIPSMPLEYAPIHRLPILVPDPNGAIVRPDGTTWREDLRAALLTVVRQTLADITGA